MRLEVLFSSFKVAHAYHIFHVVNVNMLAYATAARSLTRCSATEQDLQEIF